MKSKWQKIIRRNTRSVVLDILPKYFAHRWIRKSLNLTVPQSQSKLRFEILSEPSDIRKALQLVQQSFEREGYARKTSSGIRLTPYHLLPETLVIAAKDGERIIASMSVIPRTAFGVPLDSSFSIDNFLSDKGRVVEMSALAVDPSARGHHGETLYNLMKFMYHCNVDILDAQTEVIGVNPKMLALYEAVLLFDHIPGTKSSSYDFANGAPVVPMHFSLKDAVQSYEAVYSGKPPHLNLMGFFLLPVPTQYSLPRQADLNSLLPQRDPIKLQQMLSWDQSVFTELSAERKNTLVTLYAPWPACAELIRKAILEK